MKTMSTLFLVVLVTGLSSFRDPYWHAMYTIKNETPYSLLVEIDWKQTERKPKEQIIVRPQGACLIYFEDGIDVPRPEEVFKELRLKAVQDGLVDNFCVFNEENEPNWDARYDLFDIYYSLDVRKSDSEYMKNSKMTSRLPR